MFETTYTFDVSQLKGGRCENPCSDRGPDSKAIGKTKARSNYHLDLKFGLPHYYVSGKYGEDEDNRSSNSNTNSTHDAIISVSYHAQAFKLRVLSFDLTNACLVPTLKNEKGANPRERWDFSKRRHLLDHYRSITEQKRLKIGVMIVSAGPNLLCAFMSSRIKNGFSH